MIFTNLNSAVLFTLYLFSVLFTFLTDQTAYGQDYVTIRVGTDLPVEVKTAIGEIAESNPYNNDKLASGLKGALSISEICKADHCDNNQRIKIEEFAHGNLHEVIIDRLEHLQIIYENVTGSSGTNYIPSLTISTTKPRRTRKFLLLNTNSIIYRAYKGSSVRLPEREPEIAAVPVPHLPTGISAGIITSNGQSVAELRAVLIENLGVDTLAAFDRDIENLGFTARTLEIPTHTQNERIQRAISIINKNRSSSAIPTNEARNVDIDWPITDTALSSVADDCNQLHQNWPYDAALVDQLLSFNKVVLMQLGQFQLERSKIVIVDSGLPRELARSTHFRRLLYADTRELLSHGSYYPDRSLQQPHCEDVDAIKTGNAFGHVPSAEPRDICVSHNPIVHLAPPTKSNGSGTYMPAHGGFVGGLAAGGPDLIDIKSDLDQHIGLSFARIIWTNGDENQIRSDAPDVAEAIRYATLKNADVLNASLKVRNDLHNELREKLREFREIGGLVIAAAGNSGGELLPNSWTFPAAMATPEGNDWLIVVGGAHRALGGVSDIEPWPSSAFSSVLVDIAAPASNIVSYDMSGRRMCQSGTSASAPQVSFVAGLLKSFGIRSAAEIKRRILATADHADNFTTRVRSGRVLNIINALDVFVDLVWPVGEKEPKRVVLLPPESVREDAVILHVCNGQSPTLASAKGWIDAKRLIYWRRLSDRTAEIWHRRQADPPITPLATKCAIGDFAFNLRYLDLQDGEIKLRPLSDVDRVVPSRLRNALPIAQKILLGNG